MIVDTLHVYDDLEPRAAAMNMAIDEALATSCPAPSLRFYRWEKPAVSFGYFSSFDEAKRYAAERELVRRWTGGGIVPHGTDVTYSFTVPRTHTLWSASPRKVYEELHAAVAAALQSVGVTAVLAETNAARVSDACFANPVRADVMLDGRKIAGAAQRKTRAGMLHQGSIQLEDLSDDFRERFASAVCDQPQNRSFSSEVLANATMLAEQQYGTTAWLMRR